MCFNIALSNMVLFFRNLKFNKLLLVVKYYLKPKTYHYITVKKQQFKILEHILLFIYL